jgi:type VI secretion system protein ImpK
MFDSMVALMRPTALHAALLSDGAQIPAIQFWRARCGTLAQTLQQEMQDRSFSATDIQEISLAQCVLLDELTLHALPSRQHEDWLRDPLQRRFHGVSDGAARVWARIEASVDGGHPDHSRLEFYGILLGMGFDGGRDDATAYLDRVKSALNWHRHDDAALSPPDSPAPVMTLASPLPPPRLTRLRRSPGGVIAGVVAGAIVVASLWTVLDRGLDATARGLSRAPATQGNPIQTERSQ